MCNYKRLRESLDMGNDYFWPFILICMCLLLMIVLGMVAGC